MSQRLSPKCQSARLILGECGTGPSGSKQGDSEGQSGPSLSWGHGVLLAQGYPYCLRWEFRLPQARLCLLSLLPELRGKLEGT